MTDALTSFREAAAAFRRLVESPGGPEYPRRLRNAVARLYLAGTCLPERDEDDVALPDLEYARSDFVELARRVASALGRDAYELVWDPFRGDADEDEPITSSISQELVEIYDDLARAEALLARGTANDVWDVRWDFEEHWGRHALAVLRPLHLLATGR